ncbi:CPBP family intramembrane glutamic endopeptidase [Flavobacterium suaedae]|uniref:CPBP family intramembrane glutamic endopeptidase n=1 Tax=Flavobacterium suaedae TaxID=1767027 RepID=UPI003570A300
MLLLVLEFFITFLGYYFLPKSNLKVVVQVAIDVSLLLTFLIGNTFLVDKNHISKSKSNLNFKAISIYFLITLLWVYSSPILRYPFLQESFNFSEIKILHNGLNSIINSNHFFNYHIVRIFIITPILEELVFRKLILSYLNSKYGFFSSVVITSALFSISHLDINNILIFFTGSIFLCLIYLKTNNIKYSIALHIWINLLTLIL